MDELITTINGFTTYPGITDLHALAMQINAYSTADQQTVLAALTNKLLVTDIKRLMDGDKPQTMFGPAIDPSANV
ncbi:hypothetical protein BG58_11100 [Caballeronia jiangsuensis]|nr:hypothetical protein BG58_11100 [Caballeronia jiangsuensis]